jgi:hypothetical protein
VDRHGAQSGKLNVALHGQFRDHPSDLFKDRATPGGDDAKSSVGSGKVRCKPAQ